MLEDYFKKFNSFDTDLSEKIGPNAVDNLQKYGATVVEYLQNGSKVEINYHGGGNWYPGKICHDHGDKHYDVVYDDGDSESYVDASLLRTIPNGVVSSGEETGSNLSRPYMVFDFRKGKHMWPTNVENVNQDRADILLAAATEEAEDTIAKAKKLPEDSTISDPLDATVQPFDTDLESVPLKTPTEITDDRIKIHPYEHNPDEVDFETLSDGTSAFILKRGHRLKLNLAELLDGGDEGAEKRKLAAAEEKRKQEKIRKQRLKIKKKSATATDLNEDKVEGGTNIPKSKSKINEYTITIDMKLIDKIPTERISLFQTGLTGIVKNESGDDALESSDGECLVGENGGVGIMDTFGDDIRARLLPGTWARVVIAVKCAKSGEKGEFATWVHGRAGVLLKDDKFVTDGRFSLDPENFYLFSSVKAEMMPGNIAIRMVRVEQGYSDNAIVKDAHCRDRVRCYRFFNSVYKYHMTITSVNRLLPSPDSQCFSSRSR